MKKIISLFLSFVVMFSFFSLANITVIRAIDEGNKTEDWIKNYGSDDAETFNSVIRTSDGGFVAVGYKYAFGSQTNPNAIIVKFNSSGQKGWDFELTGNKDDSFSSVIETHDGYFIAVGESNSLNSSETGFSNSGSTDAIIFKFNSSGVKIWGKSFGGAGNDSFLSVIEITEGKYLAAGTYNSTGGVFINNKGFEDCMIVEFDNAGEYKSFISYGGDGFDYFNSIIKTTDGGFVAVGSSDSSTPEFTNIGTEDAIIVKYSSIGDVEWANNYGGNESDYFNSVVQTTDGGFVAVGNSSSTDIFSSYKGSVDAMIVKFKSNGDFNWANNYGGDDIDIFYSVIQTSDGSFVAVGESYSDNGDYNYQGNGDAIIVKINSAGDKLWAKNYGGNNYDVFNGIANTSGEDFVAVGRSGSPINGLTILGDYDAIIVKYKSLITFDKSLLDFGSVELGYSAIGAKVLTLNNNVNVADTLNYSFSSTNFTATGTSLTVPASDIATISVTPNTGLAAGTYNETLTIKRGSTVIKEINLKLTITNPGPNTTIDKDTLDFGSVVTGYSAITAKTLTFTNNVIVADTLTYSLPATSNFTVGGGGSITVPASNTATLSITPKTGLVAGTYNETLTIKRGSNTIKTVNLKLVVSDYYVHSLSDVNVPAVVVDGNIHYLQSLTVVTDNYDSYCSTCQGFEGYKNDNRVYRYYDIKTDSTIPGLAFIDELTISFNLGQSNNGKTFKIIHCNEDGIATYTKTCINGIVQVRVTKLSPFVILKAGSDPSTGDSSYTLIAGIFMISALATYGYIALKRKPFNK